jgi:hypothetical protein
VISLEQAVEYALPETPTNAFKDDDPAHTPGARSSSSSRQQRSKTACAKTRLTALYERIAGVLK